MKETKRVNLKLLHQPLPPHGATSDRSARHLKIHRSASSERKLQFKLYDGERRTWCEINNSGKCAQESIPCPLPTLLSWATYSEIFLMASTWKGNNHHDRNQINATTVPLDWRTNFIHRKILFTCSLRNSLSTKSVNWTSFFSEATYSSELKKHKLNECIQNKTKL